MKYSKTLAFLLLISVISFYSCNDSKKAAKQETTNSIEVPNTPASPNVVTPNPATLEPSQNTSGVWHYTCSKGCAGGAGSAVNCATCGTLLAHNSGYHANTNTTPVTSPFATQPAAQTGQNAAGVWHYTCGNGCAGGAGAAGSCSTCGNALAHNAAYH